MANEPYFATNYMERLQVVMRNGKPISRIMHNDKCVYNFLDSLNRWEPGTVELLNTYPNLSQVILNDLDLLKIFLSNETLAQLVNEDLRNLNIIKDTGYSNIIRTTKSFLGFTINDVLVNKTDIARINILVRDFASYAFIITCYNNNAYAEFQGTSDYIIAQVKGNSQKQVSYKRNVAHDIKFVFGDAIYIDAVNVAPAINFSQPNYYILGKSCESDIYSFEMTNDGVHSLFLPVVHNGEACLFDQNTNTFITQSGNNHWLETIKNS